MSVTQKNKRNSRRGYSMYYNIENQSDTSDTSASSKWSKHSQIKSNHSDQDQGFAFRTLFEDEFGSRLWRHLNTTNKNLKNLEKNISSSIKQTFNEHSESSMITSGKFVKFLRRYIFNSGFLPVYGPFSRERKIMKYVHVEMDFLLKFSISTVILTKSLPKKWRKAKFRKNFGPNLTPGKVKLLGGKRSAYISSFTRNNIICDGDDGNDGNPNHIITHSVATTRNYQNRNTQSPLMCPCCNNTGTITCGKCGGSGLDTYMVILEGGDEDPNNWSIEPDSGHVERRYSVKMGGQGVSRLGSIGQGVSSDRKCDICKGDRVEFCGSCPLGAKGILASRGGPGGHGRNENARTTKYVPSHSEIFMKTDVYMSAQPCKDVELWSIQTDGWFERNKNEHNYAHPPAWREFNSKKTFKDSKGRYDNSNIIRLMDKQFSNRIDEIPPAGIFGQKGNVYEKSLPIPHLEDQKKIFESNKCIAMLNPIIKNELWSEIANSHKLRLAELDSLALKTEENWVLEAVPMFVVDYKFADGKDPEATKVFVT